MTVPAKKLLLLPLLLLTLTGCSVRHALRVEDRQRVDVKTMITELGDTRLIFVGERHDEPAHHELQLEILKAKQAQGKPVAIGMEMFDDVSQRALDAWSTGKVPEQAFRKVYEWSWRNIPWEMYRDILIFARDNKVPIVALNAPRKVVQKVSKQGFASLSEDELKELPEGIDARVTEQYQAFIKEEYTSHGGKTSFQYICEAQMLRNKVMARRITDYLRQHPESAMVVIAGGGHAREQGGVPMEVQGIKYKIVLPPIPSLTPETVGKKDGDYLIEDPFF